MLLFNLFLCFSDINNGPLPDHNIDFSTQTHNPRNRYTLKISLSNLYRLIHYINNFINLQELSLVRILSQSSIFPGIPNLYYKTLKEKMFLRITAYRVYLHNLLCKDDLYYTPPPTTHTATFTPRPSSFKIKLNTHARPLFFNLMSPPCPFISKILSPSNLPSMNNTYLNSFSLSLFFIYLMSNPPNFRSTALSHFLSIEDDITDNHHQTTLNTCEPSSLTDPPQTPRYSRHFSFPPKKILLSLAFLQKHQIKSTHQISQKNFSSIASARFPNNKDDPINCKCRAQPQFSNTFQLSSLSRKEKTKFSSGKLYNSDSISTSELYVCFVFRRKGYLFSFPATIIKILLKHISYNDVDIILTSTPRAKTNYLNIYNLLNQSHTYCPDQSHNV